MKTHIVFRICLVPIKLLMLIPLVFFVVIPCSLINEEEFGDEVLSWFEDFGNYKTER